MYLQWKASTANGMLCLNGLQGECKDVCVCQVFLSDSRLWQVNNIGNRC